MTKEIDLNSNLAHKLEFTESAVGRLFLKTMLPVFSIVTAASILASIQLHDAAFMFGLIPAAFSGFGAGYFTEGRAYRRKILRFARSKDITLSRSDKRRLLKMLKTCSPENLVLGENESLDISTVWKEDVISVTAKTQPKDDFNEAFGNALTINHDELVAHFDKNRAIDLPNETPFQKGINGRVAQLNKMVVKNSQGTYIPYSVNMQRDVVDLSFPSGVLSSSFESIQIACEKDLLERLEAQYSAK